MAKSCQTCSGPVSGLFTKVCEDCQRKANSEFAQNSRNKLMDEVDAEVNAARAISPSLVLAFEKYWSLTDSGLQSARNPAVAPPTRFDANLPALVPRGEEVVSVATGIQDGIVFWALTNKNILIARYTLFNKTFKGSELVPLGAITGIESTVVNSVDGSKKIIATRAANTDEIYGVPAKPAAEFLEALNNARQQSLGGQTTPQSTGVDPADALRKLKTLLDDGLISASEFEEKRKTIMDKL